MAEVPIISRSYLLSKSTDWFLYDKDFRHERAKWRSPPYDHGYNDPNY